MWLVAAVGFATWAGGACANAAAPPGGPPDALPPRLVSASPGSGDTSVRPKSVSLQFDEVISETPKGAPELAGLVFISPRSGDVEVSWKRSRIEIRPKDGFRDSAVYTIVVRPGLQDLQNNAIDTASTFVFSTRGPIPSTSVTGVLFDWPAGRGARGALVEALSVADTTTSYITMADSVGRFILRYVPGGQYILRGFLDRNNNRSLERTELWDTVRVPLVDSADVELYAFIHDTTEARITEVAVQDSGRRLRLSFDKPLALDQLFTPPQFSLRVLPDSTPMVQRVVIVRTRAQQLALDSTERQRKADSTRAAAAARDTIPKDSATLAREDSVAREQRRDSLARAERTQRESRRLLTLRGGAAAPRVDSTPPPKPNRPIPTTELLIVLDVGLPPDTRVMVEAKDITTLNGVLSTARRALRTPLPPKDTTSQDTTSQDTTARGRAR